MYPPVFEAVLPTIMQVEVGSAPNGGWVDDPSDPGEATQWGIASKYNDDLADEIRAGTLPREKAVHRFFTGYFRPLGLDERCPVWLALLLTEANIHGGGAALADVTGMLQAAHNALHPLSPLKYDERWGALTYRAVLTWEKDDVTIFLHAYKMTLRLQAKLRAKRSLIAQQAAGKPERNYSDSFATRLGVVVKAMEVSVA